MRRSFIIVLAACSNAAEPAVDAAFHPIDAAADAASMDAPAPLHILVVNEVAAGETPDWIEIVNVTAQPVELELFVYTDVAGDLVKARAFPQVTLAPGAYFTQDIDDALSGFKLGSDEELWVYRAADGALSDGVDWPEGASPAGMSYARVPDKTGTFATGAPSKGSPNP
jgi:hypothetical protein